MEKKIKLMIVTHDLALGGLQQVIVSICSNINQDKFDVVVLCLRALGEFTKVIEGLGIRVLLIEQTGGTDYLSFIKVAKFIKQEKPDVLHTHNTQPFIDGVLASMISKVKCIIHTDHARSFPDKRRYMLAEYLASKKAYKVVGVSQHTSDNLIHYEKISINKVVTIPNGINISKFDIHIDAQKKRYELGVLGEGKIIGLCVRLSKQKGIKYLLKAFPSIKTTNPGVQLIIGGDGELKEDLQQLAKDLGIIDDVHFIGPRMDIPEILKLLDVYVLPSLFEGLPMVILEAMAAGCPVIATDVGGNRMAIQNGYTGSLVRPKDPAALAIEVVRLLQDQDLREKYMNNGRRIVEERFSAQVMTRQYEELYSQGLGVKS